MKPTKTALPFIVLALLVFFMIALNESGYGVFALFLLFPAYWLMEKAFEGIVRPGYSPGRIHLTALSHSLVTG